MPDDLPRSPSGRVPRWVVDEASGRVVQQFGPAEPFRPAGGSGPDEFGQVWTPAVPARRRGSRPVVPVLALVLLVGFGCTWWLTDGLSRAPAGVVDAAESVFGVQLSPGLRPVPPPTAEVVALAGEAHLTDEGRELLYGARPELLGAAAFAGRCDDGHAAGAVAHDGAVGCYKPGDESIVVYVPADARLHGFVVETVAHETLHAAWNRLSPADQMVVTPLLEAEVAALAPDDPMRAQIDGSVGTHLESRPTELFAYVGTQLWRDGGLAPALEAVYARFVVDRAALVAVHTGFLSQLDTMRTDIEAAYRTLVDSEQANALSRAQYDADAAAVADYRAEYQAKAAEVAAMPEERRARLRLSWRWWDGTDLPMAPAEQTLATAADLLARDDAELPAREAAVGAAEAAAAAERARLDGLTADFDTLQAQLDPTGSQPSSS
ncbi:hypothetical protein Cch01nite_15170 [Cellulomonas chitinilytica]|uniref:Uncharacterized protein n=1 Tax=Cellulomonas chitinilytica TaxID=398759 RepID=A0A919NZZ9_9CELL|nr:hypothetical protein Cch01nite_15170 [Cellulomonas chitinilytica]